MLYKDIQELNKQVLSLDDCQALHDKHGQDVICGNGGVELIELSRFESEAEKRFMGSVRENAEELGKL